MQFNENVSLRHLNSFGIDVSAKMLARFNSAEALSELPRHLEPQLILGGGSNILLTANIDGLVLKNEISGIEKVGEDDQHVYLKAGAGVNWHQFVLYCIDRNLGGVENLSLIPGCVGASPMQNIGAYGVELKDCFHELEAWHLNDRVIVRFGLQEAGFGYRESVFKSRLKGQFVILNVSFRLHKVPVLNIAYGAIAQELERGGILDPTIRSVSDAVIAIRQSKLPDPAKLGNAGSFFKNPEVTEAHFELLKIRFPTIVGYPLADRAVKLAAGWMIEQCGWKGFREGDAGVHIHQALVLVNYGSATGSDLLKLSEKMIASVAEKFDVALEREVNLFP